MYDSSFITKCDKTLLQNTLGFLVRELLKNVTILLQNATVILKCVYCKLRRKNKVHFYLENLASV